MHKVKTVVLASAAGVLVAIGVFALVRPKNAAPPASTANTKTSQKLDLGSITKLCDLITKKEAENVMHSTFTQTINTDTYCRHYGKGGGSDTSVWIRTYTYTAAEMATRWNDPVDAAQLGNTYNSDRTEKVANLGDDALLIPRDGYIETYLIIKKGDTVITILVANQEDYPSKIGQAKELATIALAKIK